MELAAAGMIGPMELAAAGMVGPVAATMECANMLMGECANMLMVECANMLMVEGYSDVSDA